MSINTLREKCQGPRRAKDTWYGRRAMRPVSIYITVLFVRMGIRAMPASVIFLASGVLSAALFAGGGRGFFLAGALMLQVFYLLDHVDGEVARYNGETSLTGWYFDELIHYMVHPLAFLGIGAGLYRLHGAGIYLAAGISAAFGAVLLTLIIDLKNLILLRHFHRTGDESGFTYNRPSEGHTGGGGMNGLFARTAYAGVYQTCTFPVVMNVVTAAAVLDVLFRIDAMSWALCFYAVFMNAVWIARAAAFISGRKIDSSWEKGQYK